MTLPYAEPYKIKMTEAIRTSTRAEITTGYRITFEAPILRHFTVELDKI